MKLKFVLVWLIFSPFTLFAQEVIQESASATAEKARISKIKEDIRVLQSSFGKADEEFKKFYYRIDPLGEVLNPTQEKLEKKLQDIEQTQYEIQRLNLKETCNQINDLRKSIGESYQDCASIQSRVKGIDRRHKEIREQITALQINQADAANANQLHEDKLSDLDKEIASLDALLEGSKVSTSSQSTSLDDFLSEKGETAGTETNSGSSLDEMLSSSDSKNSDKGNSLDDMLTGNSESANSSSLDDMLATAVDDHDFKIDHKNGLTGVINSQAKVLIPYNDWEIMEYKMGIAKVKKKGESKFCKHNYTAHKEGFVDESGEFIDGFEITFSRVKHYSARPLTIYMNTGETPAEKAANDRNYARRKEQEKRQAEIERKKCEVEINNWKQSIIAKYQ